MSLPAGGEGDHAGQEFAEHPVHADEAPVVSVCMPTARAGWRFERALRSVVAQSVGSIEVLIGDESGALRAHPEVLAESRIKYFHNEPPLGFSANHMALLDRARGEYMAVLHDDDWWEPTYLQQLVAALTGEPDAGFAFCGTALEFDDGAPGTTGDWPVHLECGFNPHPVETLLANDWFLLPSSTIWRREVWSGEARLWPDLRCGDLQLFLSGAEAGWGIVRDPDVLAHWSQHADQSGSPLGVDSGLGIATDALAFWDDWLSERDGRQRHLVADQIARWHVRRARALLLNARGSEARRELRMARDLGGARSSDWRKLALAALLPAQAVALGVEAKRRLRGLSVQCAPSVQRMLRKLHSS